MRYVMVIATLLIALPAWAGSGCVTLPATGCRSCWDAKGSSKTCPNGDWEKHKWSDYRAAVPVRRHWPRGAWFGRRHAAHRHVTPRPPRERVIERESIRYEHIIKKEVR
jgi:hypothetical protein